MNLLNPNSEQINFRNCMSMSSINMTQNLSYHVGILESYSCWHEQYYFRHLWIKLSWHRNVRVFQLVLIQWLFKWLDGLEKFTSENFAIRSCDKDRIKNSWTAFWLYCNLFIEISFDEFSGEFFVIFWTLFYRLSPSINDKLVISQYSPFYRETIQRK